jgi:hypothetical protein
MAKHHQNDRRIAHGMSSGLACRLHTIASTSSCRR